MDSHSKRVNNVSDNVMKMKNGSKLIKMLNYVLAMIFVKININKLKMKTSVLKSANITNIQMII